MHERRDWSQLTSAELAPLEALMQPSWSEAWRDLATSFYVTLICLPGATPAQHPQLAQMAVQLLMGVAQDLGGSQPYIAVGVDVVSSARFQKVVALLQQGMSYKAVAKACSITVGHVRRIESAWRQEQWAARQQSLL